MTSISSKGSKKKKTNLNKIEMDASDIYGQDDESLDKEDYAISEMMNKESNSKSNKSMQRRNGFNSLMPPQNSKAL